MVADLVNAAIQWQKDCQKLQKAGKREEDARPAKTAIQIPLKSTSTAGESSPVRLAEDQHPNAGFNSVQKLDTVSIYTHPPTGVLQSAPELHKDFPGVRGQEMLPPVFAPEPESALISNFGERRIFNNYRPFPDSRSTLEL